MFPLSKKLFLFLPLLLSSVRGTEAVPRSFFNQLDQNWELVKHDGAEGCLVKDSRGEFVLKKNNARGYLELRTLRPVKLSAGKIWYFRGEYQGKSIPEGSMLLFRFARQAGRQATYQSSGDRATSIGTESIARNAPGGQWQKRHFAVKPDQDAEWYPVIQLAGNPVSLSLRNLTVDDVAMSREIPPPPQELPAGYSTEEVRQRLEQRENCQARLAKNRFGTMSIELNGRETPAVLYKPPVDRRHWRIQSFQETGIPLVMVTVPLCHQLNKPGIPLKGRRYDWKILDQAVYHALQYAPDSTLVLNLLIYEPYLGWGEECREDIWQNDKGDFGVGNNCHLVKFVSRDAAKGILGWWPSYSSERWRTDMAEILQAMGRHVMSRDYGKAVAGVAFSSGDDGQFQYRQDDHSPAAQKAFRRYLAEKYGDISKLNQSWKTTYSGFEEIRVPRKPSGKIPFLPPGAYPDYRNFQYVEGWTLRECFAKAVKEGFQKNILTFAYGTPDTFTANYLKYAPSLDVVTTVMCYPYRLNGYPTGFGLPPVEYALHGKLWMEELDLRSWLTSIGNEFIDRAQGTLETPEDWRNGHRKLTGIALAAHQGYWYYSMDYLRGLFFGAPEIMEEIKAVQQMHQKIQEMQPNPFRPDVCLVTSDANDFHIASQPFESHANLNAQGNSLPLQAFAYETSGVPMDKASLESIMAHSELQNYKVYLFPHVTYLSPGERKFIREKLQAKHRILVWMHGTGYIGGNGKSVENIHRLTGFRVLTEEVYRRQQAYCTGNTALTRGIPPYLSLGELRLFAQAPEGLSLWGQLTQHFEIKSTGNETVLARYQDGKIAAAMLKYPEWTSIYLAAPSSLSAHLLNRIARKAGAYCAGKAGHSIMMNGNFLSIHPMFDDQWELILPDGVKEVRDAWTGELLDSREGRATVPLKCGKTRWLLLDGGGTKITGVRNKEDTDEFSLHRL